MGERGMGRRIKYLASSSERAKEVILRQEINIKKPTCKEARNFEVKEIKNNPRSGRHCNIDAMIFPH